MIRVGIAGVTGYGGRELLRLLGAHPGAEVVYATTTSQAGQRVDEILPAFAGTCDLTLKVFDPDVLAESCDVVFVGVPGTQSMAPVTALRDAGVRVLDLGPDFRLKDAGAFAKYYDVEHSAASLLDDAVYGLVPLHRSALRDAQLVAVPGCYPIGAILPLRPLLEASPSLFPPVIDAVSGVSGAGRSLSEAYHFSEMNDNVRAYKLGAHQHIPEIEQELGGATVQFSPHVGPYTRGILSTITLRLENDVNIPACYEVYESEPFVRVLGEGELPEINDVRASNFCDIGWVSDERTGNLIIVSAIDNLVGGTAGMALQCMNLMFGLDESAGLNFGGMSV